MNDIEYDRSKSGCLTAGLGAIVIALSFGVYSASNSYTTYIYTAFLMISILDFAIAF